MKSPGILLVLLLASLPSAWSEAPCATVSRLAALAAPLTGFGQLLPSDCAVLPSREFEQTLRLSAWRESDRTRLTGEETAFKLIGFIPSSFDYVGCFSGNSIEAIDSFYDIRSRRVILRAGASLPETALLAESVIALRDRMFKLSRITGQAKTSDSTLAANALIQGDLTIILAQAAKENLARPDSAPAKDATSPTCAWPEPFKELLFFPLDWGPIFASHLRQSADQQASSRAFLNPPRSTHDIIHAARYIEQGPFAFLSPEKLRKLSSPVRAERIFHDTLGQFVLQALLKHYSNATTAIRAAKGWRGDTIEVFKLPGSPVRHMARWVIAFESAQDLKELTEAFRVYAHARFGVEIDPQSTRWEIQSADGSGFSIRSASAPNPLVELAFY